MMISLPFTYQAHILPTSRHRNGEEAILRAYTPVSVPEVCSAELIPAIEIEDGGASLTLYAYQGRLMRRARSTVTGEPLTPAALELTLSEPYGPVTGTCMTAQQGELIMSALSPLEPAVPARLPTVFDTRFFPFTKGRFAPPWADEDGVDPMSHDTMDRRTQRRGWRKPAVLSSDEDIRRGQAQEDYASSFLIVDGVPFVQCPEPVWALRTWPPPRSLAINQAPKLFDARHSFRLDERALAEAWCLECDAAIEVVGPSAKVLSDGVLARDTIGELAASAIAPLRRLGVLWRYQCPDPEGQELVWRLLGGQRFLDPWEAPVLLNALSAIRESALADGTYDDGQGDWRRLDRIVARWDFEVAQGRDLRPYTKMSDDDLAALQDSLLW